LQLSLPRFLKEFRATELKFSAGDNLLLEKDTVELASCACGSDLLGRVAVERVRRKSGLDCLTPRDLHLSARLHKRWISLKR
jgi:hypothetical protein